MKVLNILRHIVILFVSEAFHMRMRPALYRLITATTENNPAPSLSDVSAWNHRRASSKGNQQKILEIPVRVLLTKNETLRGGFWTSRLSARRRRAAGACFGEPPAGWMTDELRPVKRVQQDTFGQDVVHSLPGLRQLYRSWCCRNY